MVWQESKGNAWALRYEPAFYSKYVGDRGRTDLLGHVPPEMICSLETEKRARAFSYGLLQIMGQVARENGFKGDYLTELCDPAINLAIGCAHLRRLLQQCDGDERTALKRYNGSTSYAIAIFNHLDNRNYLRILDG